MKGRSALRAVYKEEGMDNGRVPRNGASTEGVDSWRDLWHGENRPQVWEEGILTLTLYIHPRRGVLHVPKLEPTKRHQLCHQSFLRDRVVKQSATY